jgi:hypothetical protein
VCVCVCECVCGCDLWFAVALGCCGWGLLYRQAVRLFPVAFPCACPVILFPLQIWKAVLHF